MKILFSSGKECAFLFHMTLIKADEVMKNMKNFHEFQFSWFQLKQSQKENIINLLLISNVFLSKQAFTGPTKTSAQNKQNHNQDRHNLCQTDIIEKVKLNYIS